MNNQGRRSAVLILALAGFASACITARVINSLDAESRDFLSKVRYLITKQERQRFLAIPAGDRTSFMEEFWEKRESEKLPGEKSFKEEYFARIEEANRLFSEGSEPGWLQDRGRVYILLGPPTNRITYPRGVTFWDVPTEYWYYGFFPLTFTDAWWNGNYKLDPESVEQVAILNRTQKDWQPYVGPEEGRIEFKVKVERPKPGAALIEIAVPYRDIRFEIKNRVMRAILVLTLDLLEKDENVIRQYQAEYPIEIADADFDRVKAEDYVLNVPMEASPGEYGLRLILKNAKDGIKTYKKIKISL